MKHRIWLRVVLCAQRLRILMTRALINPVRKTTAIVVQTRSSLPSVEDRERFVIRLWIKASIKVVRAPTIIADPICLSVISLLIWAEDRAEPVRK